MNRKLIVTAALALLLAPAISKAGFKQADWDLTLAGAGANDKDFESYSASLSAGIGYFLADQFEVGLRPSAIISDGGSDHVWILPVFADFHFGDGNVVPFVGANLGYQFGGGTAEDSWSAGPEGGIKWFLNPTTYVFGIIQYQFSLNEGFDSGGFVYGLGLGVRL